MADAKFASRGARPHESDVVDIRRILVLGIAAIAIIAGCVIASTLLERVLSSSYGREIPAPASIRPPAISEPVLQVSPGSDLDALRASKRAALEEYRWIDHRQGVVQIPIERAMQLISERGTMKDGAQ